MQNIILCDDNTAFRHSLALLIENQNGMCLAADFSNCNNLLNGLEKIKADLVLLDINMPGINGIEGVALIKAASPTLKVIMLTVFDDDNSVFKCMQNGADGYILKKSHPDKIIEAIRDVLDGGAAMTPSVARQVLRLFALKPLNTSDYKLTSRELEILHLVVAGYNYREVSEKLFISWETVRTHVKKIYEKLQVSSKIGAVNKFLGKPSG